MPVRKLGMVEENAVVICDLVIFSFGCCLILSQIILDLHAIDLYLLDTGFLNVISLVVYSFSEG